MKVILLEREAFHFCLCYNDACGIFPIVDLGLAAQSGGGPRVADELHHGFESPQRLASPVDRDERKECMFDRIPFGGSGRIVADMQSQTCFISQLLQGYFPESIFGPITTATIREQQDLLCLGIVLFAKLFPILADGFHRKGSPVVVGPEVDNALLFQRILDPVRDGLDVLPLFVPFSKIL